MRRVIVIGGTGFFGGVCVRCLRDLGVSPVAASRRSRELPIDVEDAASIRDALLAGDVVLDAAGPYQRRSTALIEAACVAGCDVIDLADSLAYVRRVYELHDAIAAAGIRVYTACSSVSAVSAAMIQLSGVEGPSRVIGLLVPSTRHTAVGGTASSLLDSLGRIDSWVDGSMQPRLGFGFSFSFPFPPPLHRRTGFLFETADAFLLPRCWPSLQTAEMYVDANVPGLNHLFRLAARRAGLRDRLRGAARFALPVARLLGRKAGGLGYQIESGNRTVRMSLTGPSGAYVIAVAPAVLVAAQLAAGETAPAEGLVPANEQIEPARLRWFLKRHDIQIGES